MPGEPNILDCPTQKRVLLIYSFNKYLLSACNGIDARDIPGTKIKLVLFVLFQLGGKGIGETGCKRRKTAHIN